MLFFKIEIMKQEPQITVAMLAKHAGVSRVAVYAALNPEKKTTVGISDKTRAKILKAAAELNYIPNDQARTLVSGRSKTIGLLLKSNTTPLMHKLVSACSRLFVDHGYLLIAESSEGDAARERELLNRLLLKRVDCVIVGWFDYKSNKDIAAQFNRFGIPVINIMGEAVELPNSATVCFDEIQVMRLIANHLHRNGIRRVCYAGIEARPESSSVQRGRYLAEALRALPGMELSDEVAFSGTEECRAFVSQLKTSLTPPEAIVCYNDRLAQVMTVELKIAGFQIPAEIGVTGVDGCFDPYDPVRLTTVQLPVEKLAGAIFQIFRDSDFNGKLTRIPPILIENETTTQTK